MNNGDRQMDLTEMRKLRDRAFFKIVANPETEKQWHDAKTREDRELLMTWAIFEIGHARGYDDGYCNGRADGYHDGCLEQTQY